MATHTARIARDHCLAPEHADPEPFRSPDPAWTPTLPSPEPGRFGLADILVPEVA
jgi:hypothetical protein